MIQRLEAVFDGEGVHPHEPIALEPNNRVRIVIETRPQADAQRFRWGALRGRSSSMSAFPKTQWVACGKIW